MDSVLTWVHVPTNNKENNMALEILTKNLKFKIEQLSQDELEDQFELYKSLASKSVRDEIYTELLAQELDRRDEQEYA
jgi:uncharacterized UBP type Zn finger protein